MAQVTKVRVHLLVGNTYHARVHYAPSPAMRAAGATGGEVDVDARPSDAINLAVRFKAPLYVSKEVRRGLRAPQHVTVLAVVGVIALRAGPIAVPASLVGTPQWPPHQFVE